MSHVMRNTQRVQGASARWGLRGSYSAAIPVCAYDAVEHLRLLPLQVHPCDPVLAACGNGTVVQLWAPGSDSPPRIPRRAGAGPSLPTVGAAAPAAGPGSEHAVIANRSARSLTSDGMAGEEGADGDQARDRDGLVHPRSGAGGMGQSDEGVASEGGDMDGGEGAGEVDVEEVWLSPQQRALVRANRADLRRRRAEAEQAAVVGLGAGEGPFSSPLRAAWASFATVSRRNLGACLFVCTLKWYL